MSKFNCFILLAICLLKLAGSSVLEKRSVDSGTRIDHCKAASERADLRIANIIEELAEVRRELDSIRNGMCGQKCEGDWTEFQNSCYLYRTESANWTQAEEICKSIGR